MMKNRPKHQHLQATRDNAHMPCSKPRARVPEVQRYAKEACGKMGAHPKVVAAVSLAAMAAFLASAQDWTPASAPAYRWTGLASSADGARLYAAARNLYTFTNFGSIGTLTGAPFTENCSLACSADGRSIIMANRYGSGGLYVSTNFGAAWTVAFSPPNHFWNSVACSANGQMMAAASGNGFGYGIWTNAVYLSTNYGADWMRTTAPSGAGQLAMSADGSRLAIAPNNEFPSVDALYASTNFGLTWTTNHPTSELMYPVFVATSGEGSVLIVVSTPTNSSLPGRIVMSSDWGATWHPVGSVTNYLQNYSAACSADGGTIAVAESTSSGTSLFPDGITVLLLSTNSGASWSTQVMDYTNQCSVVSSVDGSRLAVALSGSLYVRQTAPVPLLKSLLRPESFELSWLLPAEHFVLQESRDLITWSNVNMTPLLNYTNLNYVVNLSRPVGPKFYRLASQ